MSQPPNDLTTLDADTRAILDRLKGALASHHPKGRRTSPKPLDYRARRQWQDDARARGEIPECGREACPNLAEPAWTNMATPLLYCQECAMAINGHNPGLCTPERPTASLAALATDVVYLTRKDVVGLGGHVAVGAPIIVAPARVDGPTNSYDPTWALEQERLQRVSESAATFAEPPKPNRAQRRELARRGRR